MGRVNVEERSIANAYEVALELGWDVRLVLGALVLLWRESQEKMEPDATAETICRWAKVKDQQEVFIQALCSAGFLRVQGGEPVIDPWLETFHICGTVDQLEGLVRRKVRAAKGANATREKWARIRAGVEPPPDGFGGGASGGTQGDERAPEQAGNATSTAPSSAASLIKQCSKQACSTANSVQFNSPQINAMQKDEEEEDTGVELPWDGPPPDAPSGELPSPAPDPSDGEQGSLIPDSALASPDPSQPVHVPRGTLRSKKAPQVLGAIKELADRPRVASLLEQVPASVQQAWLEMFVESEADLHWLRGTLLNVCIWRDTHPGQGAKPGGQRFPSWLTTWLKKDYDRRPYRGAPARPRTRAEGIDQSHQELIEQIKRGEV